MAWIDGKPAKCLPLVARALHYGDGVFSTCLVKNAQVALWARHLARLKTASARLSLLVDFAALEQEVSDFIAINPDCALKISLLRAGSARGFAALQNHALRLLQASDLPAATLAPRLGLAQNRLAVGGALVGLKTNNMLAYILAAAELQNQPDYDDLLLIDANGHLTEALYSNILWLKDGVWHTPALKNAGVHGVMRAAVLDFFAHNSQFGKLVLDEVGSAALQLAESIVLCNSLRLLRPAGSFLGRALNTEVPWRAAFYQELN